MHEAFGPDCGQGAFERGQIELNGLFPPEIVTYESNIAYTMRFMIDTKVSMSTSGTSC